MRTWLVALALLLGLSSPAHASALRIALNKGNQATAPLKVEVTTETASGMVVIDLAIPRSQAPLDHLWRIDVVVRKGKGTSLTAPVATTLDGDTLRVQLIADRATMKGLELWIRTGEHAPLAETIYALELGSFR